MLGNFQIHVAGPLSTSEDTFPILSRNLFRSLSASVEPSIATSDPAYNEMTEVDHLVQSILIKLGRTSYLRSQKWSTLHQHVNKDDSPHFHINIIL